MNTVFDVLAQLQGVELGTVVHVGAGADGLLAAYSRLTRQSVLLIDGDPETGAALRLRAQDLSWANVCTQVVTADGGDIDWHAYNLSALNGPLDARPLAAYFPRLRELRSTRERSLPISQLLAQQAPSDDSRSHMLLLDVPGQEAALLAAVPQELLARFAIIVVRGCREALPPLAAPAGRAVQDLQDRGWRIDSDDGGRSAPLWPIRLLRLDHARQALMGELRRRTAQLTALETTIPARDQRLAELETAAHEARLLAVSSTRLAAERDAALQAATQEAAQAKAAVAMLEARVAELSQKLAEQVAASSLQLTNARQAADAAAVGRHAIEAQHAAQQTDSQQQLTDAELRQRALQQRLTAAEQREVTLQQQLADAEQRGVALQQRLAEAEAETAQQDAALQQRLQSAERQLAAALCDLAASQTAAAAFEAQWMAAQAQGGQALTDAIQREADFQQRLQTALHQLAAARSEASASQAVAARDADRERSITDVQRRQAADHAAAHAADQLAAHAAAQSALQTRLDELGISADKARTEAAGRQEAMQRELDAARQSAAIALRLQLLRESDLKQLQERYAVAQTQLRGQTELLGKVAQRLTAANQYFLQLSQDPGQGSVLPDSVDRLAMRPDPGLSAKPASAPVDGPAAAG